MQFFKLMKPKIEKQDMKAAKPVSLGRKREEQSCRSSDVNAKGKGNQCFMSTHCETGALFLQFGTSIPGWEYLDNRIFFFFYNNHSGYKQSLGLIQPISKIRDPTEFSISAILLASHCSYNLRQRWQSQASHPPRIHLETLIQRVTKGSVSSLVTFLSGKNILLRNPSSFVSNLLAIDVSHAYPTSGTAFTLLRSRALFLIPKEKSELC